METPRDSPGNCPHGCFELITSRSGDHPFLSTMETKNQEVHFDRDLNGLCGPARYGCTQLFTPPTATPTATPTVTTGPTAAPANLTAGIRHTCPNPGDNGGP